MEAAWSAPWNPQEPIKLLFNRLDFYVLSVSAKLAYTQERMIDKALTAIQRTGLYPIAIVEYQGFTQENKNREEFKSHFAEAYMIRLQSGQSYGNPYHGATNAYEADNNDSITTLHNTIANLTHAANANTTDLNAKITNMVSEMHALRTTVAQQAHQLANIATTPTVATPEGGIPPTWAAPPSVPTNIYLNPTNGTTTTHVPPPAANYTAIPPLPLQEFPHQHMSVEDVDAEEDVEEGDVEVQNSTKTAQGMDVSPQQQAEM